MSFFRFDLEPRVIPPSYSHAPRVHQVSRLRNGCRYHVHGCCQTRPSERQQVRVQGHPRRRGRAQEGGRRTRHPPGTKSYLHPTSPINRPRRNERTRPVRSTKRCGCVSWVYSGRRGAQIVGNPWSHRVSRTHAGTGSTGNNANAPIQGPGVTKVTKWIGVRIGGGVVDSSWISRVRDTHVRVACVIQPAHASRGYISLVVTVGTPNHRPVLIPISPLSTPTVWSAWIEKLNHDLTSHESGQGDFPKNVSMVFEMIF